MFSTQYWSIPSFVYSRTITAAALTPTVIMFPARFLLGEVFLLGDPDFVALRSHTSMLRNEFLFSLRTRALSSNSQAFNIKMENVSSR
jgi:hypothetical protein